MTNFTHVLLTVTSKETTTMNKARIRHDYTVTGTFIGDLSISLAIGVTWYFILVAFWSL